MNYKGGRREGHSFAKGAPLSENASPIIGERKAPWRAEGQQAASTVCNPHQVVFGEGRPAFQGHVIQARGCLQLCTGEAILSAKLNMSQGGWGWGEDGGAAEASRS